MLLRMLSFLLYQQHTWSLQHVLYFFLPTIFFFSGSRRLQDNLLFHVVYRLYFSFCHARGLSRCIHHYHPTFMRYTFTTSVLT